MGNISHRNNDFRTCGATTQVVGQSFVKINGQLWAVQGDPDSHGEGQIITTQTYVKINGIPVSLVNDQASADTLCFTIGFPHCDPFTSSGDSTVTIY